jgi:hypothetical protein
MGVGGQRHAPGTVYRTIFELDISPIQISVTSATPVFLGVRCCVDYRLILEPFKGNISTTEVKRKALTHAAKLPNCIQLSLIGNRPAILKTFRHCAVGYAAICRGQSRFTLPGTV